MKALVTAAEVRTFAKTGSRVMTVNPGDIVTPAAWDEAKEIGIAIECGAIKTAEPAKAQEQQNVDAAFLAKVVNEVIACLQQSQGRLTQAVENDPCGLRLYRGDCLSYAGEQVKTAELVGNKESRSLSARLMKLQDTVFPYEAQTDQTIHVVEGKLECTVGGVVYGGVAGDSFFLPARRKVNLGTKSQAVCFVAAAG